MGHSDVTTEDGGQKKDIYHHSSSVLRPSSSLFPSSYEDSRTRFIRDFELLRPQWANSHLESYPLKADPSLSIDYAWAEPRKKEKLIIISTAQHGIEGYVGSAMLKIFMDEFAPQLKSENTGLLLIHAINPWGMKYNRKVNENSVDLNRNFVFGNNFGPAINPAFHQIKDFINPQSQILSYGIENFVFWARVIKAIFNPGSATVTTAALLGQHHTPNGFYYGGTQHEESTALAMQLYHLALKEYDSVIHIDMHTGYGPRYQMSIIMSPLDPMTSEETSKKFKYPLVLKVNAEEFYAISGDMAAYYYELQKEQFPNKQLFACGFEFGTFGSSLLARIRSLKAMVFENQLHWHGAKNEKTTRQIRKEFSELYFPTETKWREKAFADCRLAFDGMLKAYGLLTD